MDGTRQMCSVHAQELVDMGLNIPRVTQIFLDLRKKGLDVPNVYTIEQAVDTLIRLKEGNARA